MTRTGWTNLAVPDELAEEMDRLVEKGRFRSRGEIARAGIRHVLDQNARHAEA